MAKPHKSAAPRPIETPERRIQRLAYMKEYRAANKDKMRESMRRWHEANRDHVLAEQKKYNAANRGKRRNRELYAQYRITLAEWDALFEAQNRCCALCRRESSGSNGWATDHDHSAGPEAVRGILCARCNLVLGKIGDDLESVEDWTSRALVYLKFTAAFQTPMRLDRMRGRR